MNRHQSYFTYGVLTVFTLLFFQNCGQPGSISADTQNKTNGTDGPPIDICNGVSCTLDPLTNKPAVTTILVALGDEANQQLVVNGSSAQLIAETVIRYSSPKTDPKILLVQDQDIAGEDPEDTVYVKDVLLKRYRVDFIVEPTAGLTANDLKNYDVVWFNNPGHSMSSKNTRNTLIAFAGAVVLQGDDLSRGKDFSLTELTGLKYVDNGEYVSCGGTSYFHNNNGGEQFRVGMDATRFANTNPQDLQFRYGNDIDLTTIASNKVEVFATATGGPASCVDIRPAIVRLLK